MTKSAFFKLLDTRSYKDKAVTPFVTQGSSSETFIVELCNVQWCDATLYKPHYPYGASPSEIADKCRREKAKYERWLAEWLSNR